MNSQKNSKTPSTTPATATTSTATTAVTATTMTDNDTTNSNMMSPSIGEKERAHLFSWFAGFYDLIHNGALEHQENGPSILPKIQTSLKLIIQSMANDAKAIKETMGISAFQTLITHIATYHDWLQTHSAPQSSSFYFLQFIRSIHLGTLDYNKKTVATNGYKLLKDSLLKTNTFPQLISAGDIIETLKTQAGTGNRQAATVIGEEYKRTNVCIFTTILSNQGHKHGLKTSYQDNSIPWISNEGMPLLSTEDISLDNIHDARIKQKIIAHRKQIEKDFYDTTKPRSQRFPKYKLMVQQDSIDSKITILKEILFTTEIDAIVYTFQCLILPILNKKIQELNASKPLLPFTLASIEIQQQKNTEVMRLINQRLELSITEMAAILIHFKIPHTEANNLQYSPDFMDALFNEQTEVALGKEIIKIFNDLLDLGFKTRLMHVHHQFLLDKINRDTYQQIGQWLLDTNVIQLRTNTSAELANTLSASIHSTLSPELLTSLVKKVEKATNRFTTQKGGTKQTPASLSALEKNIRNQIKNNFNMELTSLDDEREGQYHRELIHDLFGFFTAPIPENGLPLAIIQHTHKNYAVYDNVGLVSRNTKNSTITLPAYLIDFLWSNPDQKQPIIIHAPSLMYLQAKTLDAIAQQHHPEEKSPYKNLYESYSTLRQQFQATGKQTGQDSQHQLIFAKTAWGLYKVGLSSKKYILSTIRQAILLNANTFIGNKLVESSLPLAQLIEDKFPACSAVTIKDDHKQATGTTVANTNTSSSLTVVCYANNKREFSRLLTFFKSLSYPIEIDNTFYVITIRNANNLHKDYKRSNESTTSTITSLISRFGMRKSSDMSTQASTISTTANKDEKFSPEIFQKTIALIIGENKQTFKIILELIDPKRGEYSKALLTACAYLNKATKDADYNTTVFLIDYMTNPKSRPPTLEINKKSKTHGWAAIHYAAQGHHRAYEILETNGADINLREDKAPYRIAAEMLAQHPAPTTTTTAPVKKFG